VKDQCALLFFKWPSFSQDLQNGLKKPVYICVPLGPTLAFLHTLGIFTVGFSSQ